MKKNSAEEWLVLRADAGSKIGVGHVLRLIALAESWRELGGKVLFVCRELSPSIIDRFLKESWKYRLLSSKVAIGSLKDASETAQCAQRCGAKIVVLDGYKFSLGYQRKIKSKNLVLGVVDDCNRGRRFDCNWIINPNPHAQTKSFYRSLPKEAHLLAGSRFALIRREFKTVLRKTDIYPNEKKRMLVTFGGGRHSDLCRIFISALSKSTHLFQKYAIIMYVDSRDIEKLESFKKTNIWTKRVEIKPLTNQMAKEFILADEVISAAGTTALELNFMKVSAWVIVLANNQEEGARYLSKRGAVRLAGSTLRGGHKSIKKMFLRIFFQMQQHSKRKNQKNIIDGLGADRVAAALLTAVKRKG